MTGRHLGFWQEHFASCPEKGQSAWRCCPHSRWRPWKAWSLTEAPRTLAGAMAAAEEPSWEDEVEEDEEEEEEQEEEEEEQEDEEEEEDDDEDDDEEEEEQFVLVELSGIIDSDFLSKCENKCKILGIDTERPILQVDSYVFAGEYEDTLGTSVIFEEHVEHVDAEGTDKTMLKYKCHTMKKLSMTRTLLTEKKEGEENIDGVEWLQLKDNDFAYRPTMICSFMHEDEVAAAASGKPLELEAQESQMKDRESVSYAEEQALHLEPEESGSPIDAPSEAGRAVFMETEDAAFEITPR